MMRLFSTKVKVNIKGLQVKKIVALNSFKHSRIFLMIDSFSF